MNPRLYTTVHRDSAILYRIVHEYGAFPEANKSVSTLILSIERDVSCT